LWAEAVDSNLADEVFSVMDQDGESDLFGFHPGEA